MALWNPCADIFDSSSANTSTSTSVNTSDDTPSVPVHPHAKLFNECVTPITTGKLSPEGNSSGYHSMTSTVPQRPEILVSPSSKINVESLSDDPDFQHYEQRHISVMLKRNDGRLVANNPRMRRTVRSTNSDAGDDVYRNQRAKNNLAAKQSRDKRRLKEIHLKLKVSYLKEEMGRLKAALHATACRRCQQNCLC